MQGWVTKRYLFELCRGYGGCLTLSTSVSPICNIIPYIFLAFSLNFSYVNFDTFSWMWVIFGYFNTIGEGCRCEIINSTTHTRPEVCLNLNLRIHEYMLIGLIRLVYALQVWLLELPGNFIRCYHILSAMGYEGEWSALMVLSDNKEILLGRL